MTTPTRRRARTTPAPHFRTLSRRECEAILRRNQVGRLAYSFHDRVDIEPIHFVFAQGALWGRTSHGTKLETIAHSPWVAFEVDEVEGAYQWRSVVVHGVLYLVDDDGHDEAVDLLRTVFPEVERNDDPAPWRDVIFQVAVDTMTGRAAG